jgi:hypothetical protein
MTKKELECELDYEDLHEAAIRFDGLDAAIIGRGSQYPSDALLVYSGNGILDILMKDQGMDYEEAVEWCDHNISCLYAGEGTPIIVWESEDNY